VASNVGEMAYTGGREIQMTVKELWKPIAGWAGWYEISDLGHVRRIKVGGSGSYSGKVLKGSPHPRGYIMVVLHSKLLERRASHLIHRLVAAAFLPTAPEGAIQVNHKNGNKKDNRAINLEWVTPKENQRHAVSIGLIPLGERNPAAKLSDAAAVYIRVHYQPGRAAALATKFGVSRYTVWEIGTGRSRFER